MQIYANNIKTPSQFRIALNWVGYEVNSCVMFHSGSAITGPVAKECADLWPRIASNAGSIQWNVQNMC